MNVRRLLTIALLLSVSTLTFAPAPATHSEPAAQWYYGGTDYTDCRQLYSVGGACWMWPHSRAETTMTISLQDFGHGRPVGGYWDFFRKYEVYQCGGGGYGGYSCGWVEKWDYDQGSGAFCGSTTVTLPTWETDTLQQWVQVTAGGVLGMLQCPDPVPATYGLIWASFA